MLSPLRTYMPLFFTELEAQDRPPVGSKPSHVTCLPHGLYEWLRTTAEVDGLGAEAIPARNYRSVLSIVKNRKISVMT